MPADPYIGEWIQADLLQNRVIEAIVTKSNTAGYVSRFNVSVSDTGEDWIPLQSVDNTYRFAVDQPESTGEVMIHPVLSPVSARYVRLTVEEFDTFALFKWGIHGCQI